MASILLAEDSVDIAQLLSLMLQKDGHSVDVACDGQEAVQFLDDGRKYDVILTDLMMPRLDGFGLIRYIKDSNNSKVPIIVMSGGGVTISSEDALAAVKPMVFAVMEKPVDCSDLNLKIEAAIILGSLR